MSADIYELKHKMAAVEGMLKPLLGCPPLPKNFL
jgi:hypothetical protein